MGFQVNKDLIFTGTDLSRPRMTVEKEKLYASCSGFSFYSTASRISSIKGYLSTSYGHRYYVKIKIPENYPYNMPSIWLPYENLDSSCGHLYSDGSICIMKSDQWSTTLSLAFLVKKTAVWLNKYDSWKRNGRRRWPGKDQHR